MLSILSIFASVNTLEQLKDTYSLRICDIVEETNESRLITFAIPEELGSLYQFVPGQYVTLSLPSNPEIRRCYSICAVPGAAGLQIGVKKVEGGVMSTYLVEEARVGDSMEVKIPEGSFQLETNVLAARQYVFVAGGSGITPVRSMIAHLITREPLSKMTLLYGNKDQDSIIFDDYFKQIADNDRFTLVHCLEHPPKGWTGETGLLSYEKIYALTQHLNVRYDSLVCYICGPKPMMDNAKHAFASIGVPDNQINLEYFAVAPRVRQEISAQSRGVVLLQQDGEQTIEVKPEQTILDAALANGIELSYSCKQGVCSSCKLRLTGGTVEQTIDLTLSESDKAAGYILTCCAYPTSNKVRIDCRDQPISGGLKRRVNRRMALVGGILLGVLLLGAMALPSPSSMMALGPMNTGHENLACEDCHSPAKGTLMQQAQANFQHFIGNRSESVAFGSDDVDNKKCESCHKRPNDRHPMHRFKEPRFKEARAAIGVAQCESCHSEHRGVRLTTTDLTFCSHCHQDTELTDDPLNIPHAELIADNQWVTCLQCHDFHGNHEAEVPHLFKDTIPVADIFKYAQGGADPYGGVKTHSVEAISRAIQQMNR